MRLIFIAVFFLLSCNNKGNTALQSRVDSLQVQLDQSYKPGLGEFMTQIQLHHSKLWFAGINSYWKLADFEIHEIEESLENIQKYNTDRPEAKSVSIIQPSIDSLTQAISSKNTEAFKKQFYLLTESCNNCHHATAHEFNVVTVPTTPPVTNQDFKGN
jgi:hypothetical protein